MSKWNKASAAAAAGATVTILAAFVPIGPELQGALSTVLAAALVYLVPNRD